MVLRRPNASVAALAVLASLAGACAARPPQFPQGQPLWAWSGALTDSSAVVKARVPGAQEAVLEIVADGESGGATAARRIAGTAGATASDVFTFELDDLQPSTRYRYRVAGAPASRPLDGRLRTLPDGPGRLTIAFASCASTGSNAPVWDALRQVDADLFVHMGDFHYENIRTDAPERFRRAFERALLSPRQGAFYRSTPIAYVWDDHDFGANDADGTTPSKRAAHQVYREYVPHYPLDRGDTAPIRQAFDAGRLRVILTDGRSERAPMTSGTAATRTLLGRSQKAWLLDQLKDAAGSAALVVWVNVVPWITKADENTIHGWAPWAGERREIANAIETLGLTRRLIMLSGDAHMLAIDDGTNSQYADDALAPGPVIMHAAPLHRYPRRKGGPYSHGTSTRNQQFGVMQVDDDGTTIRVTLSGRDRANREVRNMHLELVCDARGCRGE